MAAPTPRSADPQAPRVTEQPLTPHIQAMIGDDGYLTRWVLVAEVARHDGGFSVWHASDGCAPWDVEGLLAYGCRAIVADMEDEDD